MIYVVMQAPEGAEPKQLSGPYYTVEAAAQNCPPGRSIWNTSTKQYLNMGALMAGEIAWL